MKWCKIHARAIVKKNSARLQPRFKKSRLLTLSDSEATRRKYILYTIKKTISTFWRVNITDCEIHSWPSAWIVIVTDFISHSLHSAFRNRRFLNLSNVLNINFHTRWNTKGFFRSAEVLFFSRENSTIASGEVNTILFTTVRAFHG